MSSPSSQSTRLSLHPPHLPHRGESNGATFCSLIFSCSTGSVRADCCLHGEKEEEGGLTSSLTCGDTAETSPFHVPHVPVSQPPLTTPARNDQHRHPPAKSSCFPSCVHKHQ